MRRAPAARALWSWPGFDLVKQPQQQVREQHDLAGYDWVVRVHGSMRGRVLEQADRPREQVHRSQLLAPSATVSTRGPGELDGYVAMQLGVVAEQVDKELAVRWVTAAGAFLAAPGRPLAIAALPATTAGGAEHHAGRPGLRDRQQPGRNDHRVIVSEAHERTIKVYVRQGSRVRLVPVTPAGLRRSRTSPRCRSTTRAGRHGSRVGHASDQCGPRPARRRPGGVTECDHYSPEAVADLTHVASGYRPPCQSVSWRQPAALVG